MSRYALRTLDEVSGLQKARNLQPKTLHWLFLSCELSGRNEESTGYQTNLAPRGRPKNGPAFCALFHQLHY